MFSTQFVFMKMALFPHGHIQQDPALYISRLACTTGEEVITTHTRGVYNEWIWWPGVPSPVRGQVALSTDVLLVTESLPITCSHQHSNRWGRNLWHRCKPIRCFSSCLEVWHFILFFCLLISLVYDATRFAFLSVMVQMDFVGSFSMYETVYLDCLRPRL